MRRLLLLTIIFLAVIPVNAVMINEPSFKFRTNFWLKDLKMSKNGTFAVCCDVHSLYVFNSTEILWKKDIKAVCVDINGKYLVVGDIEGNVYLFEDNGKLVWKRRIGSGVSSVAVSSNGYVIACGDKEIHYFDEKGDELWRYGTSGCVAEVAVSDNGCIAVAEDMLGNLYFFVKCNKNICGSSFCQKDWVWEYRNGWYVGRFTKLSLAYPFIVHISEDGNYIIVNGGEMRTIYVFDKFGYLLMKKIIDGIPISVATTSNTDTIAVGCDNGKVYVFDRNGDTLWKVDLMSGPALVGISPNGKFVVASSGKKLFLFDRNGKLLWIYDNFDDKIDFVSVSNNGRVVAGSSSGFVYFFRSTVKPLADFDYTPKNPKVGEKITFKAEGLASQYIWDFGDGNVVKTDKPIVTHTYSKPGNYVVKLTTVSEDGLTNSTSKVIFVKSINKPNPTPIRTPKPTPTTTPTPKKGWLPISLPKIPGFESVIGIIAMVIGGCIAGRKR